MQLGTAEVLVRANTGQYKKDIAEVKATTADIGKVAKTAMGAVVTEMTKSQKAAGAVDRAFDKVEKKLKTGFGSAAAAKTVEKLRVEMGTLGASAEDTDKAVEELEKKLEAGLKAAAAEKAAAKLRKELKALGIDTENVEKQFGQLEKRYRKGLEADKAEKAIGRLTKTMKLSAIESAKLRASYGDHAGALRGLNEQYGITSKGSSLLKASLAAVGVTVAATTALVVNSLGTFGDIEEGLIGVRKTTNLTSTEFDELSRGLEDMALRVPVATTGLLEIAEASGQLGIKGTANILKFTEVMGKLELSTDIVGKEGAMSMARLMNITREAIPNIDKLGSVFVALGNDVEATEGEILSLATEIGQATSTLKVTASDAAATAAFMKSVGVRTELGGSVVGRAMRMMSAAIGEGGEKLEYIARTAGMTAEVFKESFGKNATAVFQKWLIGLKGMITETNTAEVALETFNLKGDEINKVIPTMAINAEKYAGTLSMATKEMAHATAMEKEAAAAKEGYNKQMILTGNAIGQIKDIIGQAFAPKILEIALGFREWTAANRALLKQDMPIYLDSISEAAKSLAVNAGEATLKLAGLIRNKSVLTQGRELVKQGHIGHFEFFLAGAEKRIKLVSEALAKLKKESKEAAGTLYFPMPKDDGAMPAYIPEAGASSSKKLIAAEARAAAKAQEEARKANLAAQKAMYDNFGILSDEYYAVLKKKIADTRDAHVKATGDKTSANKMYYQELEKLDKKHNPGQEERARKEKEAIRERERAEAAAFEMLEGYYKRTGAMSDELYGHLIETYALDARALEDAGADKTAVWEDYEKKVASINAEIAAGGPVAAEALKKANKKLVKEAGDTQKALIKEYNENSRHMYQAISDFGADAFYDIWKNGEDGAVEMFASIEDIAMRTFFQIASQQIVVPVIMQAVGGISGGVAGFVNSATGQPSGGGMMDGLVNVGMDGAKSYLANGNSGGMFGNVTGMIDSFGSSYLGFGGVSTGGVASLSGTSGSGYMAGVGGGTLAGSSTPGMFGGTLSGALGMAGVGSMLYTGLGGMVGLPQNKYSGITSAIGGGLGASLATGSMGASVGAMTGLKAGSWAGPIGMAVGALIGGLVSGIFGSDEPNDLRVGLMHKSFDYNPMTGTYAGGEKVGNLISTEADYMGSFGWAERKGSGGGQDEVGAAVDQAIAATLGSWGQMITGATPLLSDKAADAFNALNLDIEFPEEMLGQFKLDNDDVEEDLQKFLDGLSGEMFSQQGEALKLLQKGSLDGLSENFGDFFHVFNEETQEKMAKMVRDLPEINIDGDWKIELEKWSGNIGNIQEVAVYMSQVQAITNPFDEIVRHSTMSDTEINIEAINMEFDAYAKTLENLGVVVSETNLEQARAIKIEEERSRGLTTLSAVQNDIDNYKKSYLSFLRSITDQINKLSMNDYSYQLTQFNLQKVTNKEEFKAPPGHEIDVLINRLYDLQVANLKNNAYTSIEDTKDSIIKGDSATNRQIARASKLYGFDFSNSETMKWALDEFLKTPKADLLDVTKDIAGGFTGLNEVMVFFDEQLNSTTDGILKSLMDIEEMQAKLAGNGALDFLELDRMNERYEMAGRGMDLHDAGDRNFLLDYVVNANPEEIRKYLKNNNLDEEVFRTDMFRIGDGFGIEHLLADTDLPITSSNRFHSGGRLNIRSDEGFFVGQRGEEVVTESNLSRLEHVFRAARGCGLDNSKLDRIITLLEQSSGTGPGAVEVHAHTHLDGREIAYAVTQEQAHNPEWREGH